MSFLMTNGSVDVHAWAKIRDNTSIEWAASDGEAEFTLGGARGFELLATQEGLRNLVREANLALARLDAESDR